MNGSRTEQPLGPRVYGVLALALTISAVALAALPKWTIDDAFISYRYAQNLAEHGELTWNPGEDPVEGYTGVALPVILAAGMKVGIEPTTSSKALGESNINGFFKLIDALEDDDDVQQVYHNAEIDEEALERQLGG